MKEGNLKVLKNTIKELEKYKKVLLLTCSNRGEEVSKTQLPKSSILARVIHNNLDNSTIIDVTKLKIYPCEGNVSRMDGNVCGIKEASGNMEQIMQIIRQRPNGFLVISGDDALTFPLLACGADGVISVVANAYPNLFSEMVHRSMDGDFLAARPIHLALLEFTRLMFADGSPAGIKAALKLLNICDEFVRLPLVPVRADIYQAIEKEMQHLKHIHIQPSS
jgi:hypothetical protein